ncbi:MAG: ATP-binding protein [Proteobacteria bacterium]|nr:ATP-binding protein [Pseudomonadota bacterium]
MADAAKNIESDLLKQGDTLKFLEKIKLQWMATLDAISDPIAIIDKQYTIQKSNKAMASLTSHGDTKKLVGQKCYQVFAGADKPCKGCTALKSLEKKESLSFQYERAKDGKTFEISSYPVLDDKSQEDISGVVQVYRDRTLQVKVEEKIRLHDKITSLGLLAGGIAHEINNPLSGVLLFSQMLLKEMDAGDHHYQDILEIESAAQRCKEIVQQILEFSRQAPPLPDQKITLLPLEDIISQAMRFAQVLKSAKDCRVFYEWQSRNVEVSGCRTRLMQVFLNLFKNGFQAMPGGGELYVIQRQKKVDDKYYVEVEIKDSGVGIPKKDMSKIFDPFYTTKPVGEGTGLGLAICYGLMKEMGGDITAVSEPGVGTSLFVTLLCSANIGSADDPKPKKQYPRLKVL